MSRPTQGAFNIKKTHEDVQYDDQPTGTDLSEVHQKYSIAKKSGTSSSSVSSLSGTASNQPVHGSGNGMSIRNTFASMEDFM